MQDKTADERISDITSHILVSRHSNAGDAVKTTISARKVAARHEASNTLKAKKNTETEYRVWQSGIGKVIVDKVLEHGPPEHLRACDLELEPVNGFC